MKKFLLTFVALLTTISLAACSTKSKNEKAVDDANKQVEGAKNKLMKLVNKLKKLLKVEKSSR